MCSRYLGRTQLLFISGIIWSNWSMTWSSLWARVEICGSEIDSLQCSCPDFWGDTFKYQGSGTYQLFLCAYLQHGGIFSKAEIFTALPVFALFIELVTFVLMPPPFIWARAASVSLEESKQTLVNYLLPKSDIFTLLEINSVWYSKNQFISLRYLSEHLCYPPTPP